MVAALLPVKEFCRSKQRLAGFLTSQERALLARTMFEDVWDALREAERGGQALERLLVVSAEPYVIARCREEGVACLEEKEARSHSDSVRLATQWAMGRGVTSLLSVPIDTPALTAPEILALLELHPGPLAHARGSDCRYAVVVAPSADGSGTNALLRTPPDAIAPQFGPGSCRLHVQEAETKGLLWRVSPSPGLSADIDTPEDIEAFLSTEWVQASTPVLLTGKNACPTRRCRTWALLQQWFDFAHHRLVGSRGSVPAWH